MFSFNAKAQQNLVPNGDFEDYDCCPQQIGDFNCVQYWFSPTLTTPDYYNSCNGNSQAGVPINTYGYQFAQHGNGYVGIVLNAFDGYREYISIKLSKKLESNSLYDFQFYVSTSDLTSNCGSNNMEVLFLQDTSNMDYLMMSSSTPIIINSNSVENKNIITDSINWNLISGSYIANGCEEFLLIGNFRSQEETSFTQCNINEFESYYYIDNVSVKKSKGFTPSIPNVFTPNGDQVNDFFELTDYIIDSLTVTNRWGNIVYSSSNNSKWDGKNKGENCEEGVYFYVFEYLNCEGEKEKNSGFIHLIR